MKKSEKPYHPFVRSVELDEPYIAVWQSRDNPHGNANSITNLDIILEVAMLSNALSGAMDRLLEVRRNGVLTVNGELPEDIQ